MTLPNKLSITRLILAPVLFCWFYAIDLFEGLSPVLYTAILVLVYAIMEISDLIDGKIARKYNLVTDLGKVLDPFADVICHLTFFICFVSVKIMPVWCLMIIVYREFCQSFLRMLLMGKGKPMAANIFGKAKTCLYALCSILGLTCRIFLVFGLNFSCFNLIVRLMFVPAALASLISFIIYIYNVFKQGTLESMTR